MSKERLKAELKAASYKAVAQYGFNPAIKMLEEVLEDMKKEQWGNG
jgi:hypothetical protein